MTFSKSEKTSAQRAVRYAVRTGRLVRGPCADCGRVDYLGKKTEGHHHKGYDFDHRLDVVWLCAGCHISKHLGTRGLRDTKLSEIPPIVA